MSSVLQKACPPHAAYTFEDDLACLQHHTRTFLELASRCAEATRTAGDSTISQRLPEPARAADINNINSNHINIHIIDINIHIINIDIINGFRLLRPQGWEAGGKGRLQEDASCRPRTL